MSSDELLNKLREMLNSMKDWERKPVLKSGRIVIELVKLPERRSRTGTRPEHLALLIRREDAFRGLIIVSPEELEDLRRAIASDKLNDLTRALWSLYREKSVQEFEL
ncbi:MAG: hypothetical protein ABWW65_01480 [Thermoprotei archaeon]